jgi:hypothetical protein
VSVRITNKCVDRVLADAESDIVVAEQLAKVITLIDPPTRLLRPAVIARVATVNLRRRQRDQAATATQRFGDPQAVGNRQPRASAEAYPGELHCSTRKSANAGDVAVATGGSSSPQNRHDENLSRAGADRFDQPARSSHSALMLLRQLRDVHVSGDLHLVARLMQFPRVGVDRGGAGAFVAHLVLHEHRVSAVFDQVGGVGTP